MYDTYEAANITINPCHNYTRPLVAPILLNRAKHLKFQSYVP